MLCRQCRYVLDGLPVNHCPECGRHFDPANPDTFLETGKSGRGWKTALVALTLLLVFMVFIGMLVSPDWSGFFYLLLGASVCVRVFYPPKAAKADSWQHRLFTLIGLGAMLVYPVLAMRQRASELVDPLLFWTATGLTVLVLIERANSRFLWPRRLLALAAWAAVLAYLLTEHKSFWQNWFH
jgi:hypothetical protein